MRKLSCWILFSNRLKFMHIVPRRVVLCHHRSNCSDGRMCNRLLLNYLVNSVFKLFSWNIYTICIFK